MNINIGNQDNFEKVIVYNDYPEIKWIPEYQKNERPAFNFIFDEKWIILFQFESSSFPERIFQELIVNWQNSAKLIEVKKLTEKNNNEESDLYDKETDDSINSDNVEGFPINPYMGTFSKNEETLSESEKIETQKHIWNSGIQIEKHDEQNNLVQAEIFAEKAINKVWITTCGEKRGARNLLVSLINTLRYLSNREEISYKEFCICNCSICKIVGKESSHKIEIGTLSNLKKNFVPKIQCYSSGRLRLLDDISIEDRPEINILIIHSESPENRLDEQLEKRLKAKRGWLNIKIENVSHFKAGDKSQILEEQVFNAHIIIVLLSSDLYSNDEIMDKAMPKVTKRAENGNLLIRGILVEKFSWEGGIQIELLNQSPFSRDSDHAEIWEKTMTKFFRDTELWLEEISKKKLN